MASIPVLYFCFANQADRHLSNLEKELEAIEKKLLNKDARNKIKFKKEGKTKIDDIFTALPYYRRDLTLFHYAGHASSETLDFVGQAADADSLADFFGNYPKLKLVFLNGCSTLEQVNGLINAGVDAVIATSVKIQDSRAKDFAIQFYHSFVDVGDRLGVAYEHAVQHILMPDEYPKEPEQVNDEVKLVKVTIPAQQEEEEKKYRIIPKPVNTRGQGVPILAGDLPWGLYYREPEILNWKLQDDFPKDKQVDLKALQLVQKEQILAQLIMKLEEADRSVLEWSAKILALPNDDPREEELSQELNQAKFLRLRLEKKVYLAKKFINELKTGEEAKLRSALNQINYKEQIDFFDQWKHKKQVGAFLIQGSPKCGHSLLAEELVPKDIFNFSDDRFLPVPVYFEDVNHNNSYEKEAIWQNLHMALRMRPARDQLSQKVTTEIKKILQKQNLMLLFDGINHLAAEAVCTFWAELQALLKPSHLDLQTAYPNRLILILLDRYAELEKDAQSQGWKAVSYLKFKEVFDTVQPPFQAPDILKPITPLQSGDIKAWLLDSDLPDDVWLDDQTLKTITQESKGYVLPTIRGLCEKIGHPKIYENYYDHFDFE